MSKNKYSCVIVTQEIVDKLAGQEDVVLYRLLHGPLDIELSCPMFYLDDSYYEQTTPLDDRVQKFISSFPGEMRNATRDRMGTIVSP